MQNTGLTTSNMYWELLLAWTLRTIRARYKQSLLGGVWAVLQPAATVAIFTVVFTLIVPIDTGGIPYPVFSFTAMVPWVLFSTSMADMVDSLVINMNLVSKIYFPREILPIAAMLARLVDFGIAFVVLVLLMVLFGVPILHSGWIYVPAILAIQLSLSLGLGLAGAATNVFFRDVKHLFTLALQLWLYATPVIYPVTRVPEWLRPFYFMNPMAGVVEAYRAALLRGEAPGSYVWISAIVAALILFAGFTFFKRAEPKFADVV